jgi:hypothetical protein
MIMRGEKQLTLFASRTEDGKVRDDIFVSITIHNVPADLVRVLSKSGLAFLSWRIKRSIDQSKT